MSDIIDNPSLSIPLVNNSEDDDEQRVDFDFIEYYFPDTIQTQYLPEFNDILSELEFDWDEIAESDNSVANEEQSFEANDTNNKLMDDINVLFWNLSGYRLSRVHLEKALDH